MISRRRQDVPFSLVFAFAAAIHAARYGDLRIIDRQGFILVVEHQRDLAEGKPTAFLGAVEDDVLHLRTSKRLRALFAKHPAHRVRDVGFSAAVRPDHAGDALFKGNLHAIGERLESMNDEFL